MEDFKILLTPWKGDTTAPPYIDSTFTESIEGNDPYNKPVYNNDWFTYTPMRAGQPVPLTDEYRLPDSLYWICSGVEKLDTDYYAHSKGVILSEPFYNFLKGFSCPDVYEVAEVTALSKKLQPITDKKYFFLRFSGQQIKEFIDLDKSEKQKRANKVVPMFLYKIFVPKKDTLPDYFWFKSELIAKQPLGDAINNQNYKGFKMVDFAAFAEEINFRDNNPYPTDLLLQQRDTLMFGNDIG